MSQASKKQATSPQNSRAEHLSAVPNAPHPGKASLEGHGHVELLPGSSPGQAQVHVSDLQGRSIELQVEFSAQGPKVHLRAASVQVQTPGAFDVACHEFRVRAQSSIEFQTPGDFRCELQGYASTVARGISMQATHGSILAKANDNVQLMGDTLLLNCEPEQERPDWAPPLTNTSIKLQPESSTGDPEILKQLR